MTSAQDAGATGALGPQQALPLRTLQASRCPSLTLRPCRDQAAWAWSLSPQGAVCGPARPGGQAGHGGRVATCRRRAPAPTGADAGPCRQGQLLETEGPLVLPPTEHPAHVGPQRQARTWPRFITADVLGAGRKTGESASSSEGQPGPGKPGGRSPCASRAARCAGVWAQPAPRGPCGRPAPKLSAAGGTVVGRLLWAAVCSPSKGPATSPRGQHITLSEEEEQGLQPHLHTRVQGGCPEGPVLSRHLPGG